MREWGIGASRRGDPGETLALLADLARQTADRAVEVLLRLARERGLVRPPRRLPGERGFNGGL